MAGLYIHIPYCHSKCAYCDFYSTPNRDTETALVDALTAEWRMRRTEVGAIDTIYIGGGTPSILTAESTQRLVMSLPRHGLREFTIEANPEDISAERVALWRGLGIDRVSMGVQSLVDSELRLIGRRHSADDALSAVDVLRRGGIDNLSLDLIYGLPGQTPESWRYSLDTLLDLGPQHMSAYMLSYEPHTRLTAMLNSGRIRAVDEDEVLDMYAYLIKAAAEAGYEHYEISNFGRPGHVAIHNSNYWNGTPYIGLGPSAHSYDGGARRHNPSDVREYIRRISGGGVACEVEDEDEDDRFNDMLITALRTRAGLDYGSVPRRRKLRLLRDVYPFLESGDVVIRDNHLVIPEQRWMVSDAIMRNLMQI